MKKHECFLELANQLVDIRWATNELINGKLVDIEEKNDFEASWYKYTFNANHL